MIPRLADYLTQLSIGRITLSGDWGERKETVTGMTTAWKQTVLKPTTFSLLGNVRSRILSERAHRISVWVQIYTADLERECTILDLKKIVILIH